jgi:hypothetical protein
LRAFTDRPPSGTHGTGIHHLSSFRWVAVDRRNDDDGDEEDVTDPNDLVPASAYQNSAFWKLSMISCTYTRKFCWH